MFHQISSELTPPQTTCIARFQATPQPLQQGDNAAEAEVCTRQDFVHWREAGSQLPLCTGGRQASSSLPPSRLQALLRETKVGGQGGGRVERFPLTGNSPLNKADSVFPPLQINSSNMFSQGHRDICTRISEQCYLK